MKQIQVNITKQVLKDYNTYYFKKYPKRKKEPIKSPIHPSLNVWTTSVRMAANTLKQNWKDFIIWLVDNLGYSNMMIPKAQITIKSYYPTKRRSDNDNSVPKFILDGLVESKMIVDDDYIHINPLIIYGGYDKENSRTEIIIEIFEE